MKYELINGQPKQIKKATIGEMVYTNPTDALLEANNIGYSLITAGPPEVSDETKKLTHTYEIVNGAIQEIWTIVDKTPDELISMYTEQITDIYNTAESYKTDGIITYPVTGKGYIPRWVYEFYNTMIISTSALFPTPESTQDIAAVDGSTDAMTLEQFMGLFQFMISSYAGYTAEQNAQIKVLTDKIRALRNE